MRESLRAPLFAIACSACGYHALHGSSDAREHFRPTLGALAVANAVAADEVVAGAREALSQEGALGGSHATPLVIDVTRIDAAPDAIAAVNKAPVAHAEMIGVVGRATVTRGGQVILDTGDLRASALVATASDSRADSFVHEDAVRAAARRLGRKIALRAIGMPEPSEEGEGRLP